MPICPYIYLHGTFPELMKQIYNKCGIAVGVQQELLAVFVFCLYQFNTIIHYITDTIHSPSSSPYTDFCTI
jgi:hypothetical protein